MEKRGEIEDEKKWRMKKVELIFKNSENNCFKTS